MPLTGALELWLRAKPALFIVYPIIPCRPTASPHAQKSGDVEGGEIESSVTDSK